MSCPVPVTTSSHPSAFFSNCSAAGTRNAQENLLGILAKSVLKDHPPDTRTKYEQIITELVHQRGVTRHLEAKEVTSPTSFQWLYQLRYYWDPAQVDLVKQLGVLP